MSFTIGSLFDGSGGFPLAAFLCGGVPVWASEVEPYPIAVTRSRFPMMKHLGDISKINGAEIEPVDVITFGSPCQDLSVAGKRAGLKHEVNGDEETTRSGLFMEAVRIIKEMREATNGRYPTFALWENVPGAFSSNKGEDFRIVLEELVKIVEPTAVMPAVPPKGWAYSDSYCGDGWSLAYRVFDAQHWGVPQRRRRIHLVLDLGGERARKVLFEREGLRGYFAESGTPWEGSTRNAEDCAGTADREGRDPCFTLKTWDARGNGDGDTVNCITGDHENRVTDYTSLVCYPIHDKATRYQGGGPTRNGDGSGNGLGVGADGAPSNTLTAADRHAVALCYWDGTQIAGTLTVNNAGGNQRMPDKENFNCVIEQVPIVLDRAFYNQGANALYEPQLYDDGTCPTLVAKGPSAVAYVDTTHADDVVRLDTVVAPLQARDYKGGKLVQVHYVVRRLTPTECARLQGFADRWGDIEPKEDFTDEEYRFWLDVRNTHAAINDKAVKEYTKTQMVTWYNRLPTDSAEYKMWGNGIALPPALYCMQGIADVLN